MKHILSFASFFAVAALALPPPQQESVRCGPGQTLYQVRRGDGDAAWQEFRCVRMDNPAQNLSFRNAVYGEGYHRQNKAFYRQLGFLVVQEQSNGAMYGYFAAGYISGNGETFNDTLTAAFKLDASGTIYVPERGETWLPQNELSLWRVNAELKSCGRYFHRWQVREVKGAVKAQGLRCTTNAMDPGWVWYGKGWRGDASRVYEQLGASETEALLDDPTGVMAYVADFCTFSSCPAAEERIMFYFDPVTTSLSPAFTWPEIWTYKRR